MKRELEEREQITFSDWLSWYPVGQLDTVVGTAVERSSPHHPTAPPPWGCMWIKKSHYTSVRKRLIRSSWIWQHLEPSENLTYHLGVKVGNCLLQFNLGLVISVHSAQSSEYWLIAYCVYPMHSPELGLVMLKYNPLQVIELWCANWKNILVLRFIGYMLTNQYIQSAIVKWHLNEFDLNCPIRTLVKTLIG